LAIPGRATALRWPAIAAGVVALAIVFARLGVPTPPLFAGFAAGLAFALLAGWRLDLPRPAAVLSQAVIGVTVGGYLQSSTLREVASNAVAVVVVCVVLVGLLIAINW